MIGYIDKCKLLFFGRLCNINNNNLAKTIFCASIIFCAQPKTICGDLLATVYKYNLGNYLDKYVEQGIFPSKLKWRSLVCNTVHKFEEQLWLLNVSNNRSMRRYMNIHKSLNYHILWHLVYLYPEYRSALQLCIKVSSRSKFSRECTLCNKYAYDYDSHVILHCEYMLSERNNFYSILIDFLDVETYVEFEMQDETDMLSFLFGAQTPFANGLNPVTWEQIVLTFALYLFELKKHLSYTF